jgi:outer membrane receptor protein involved in Fe transport
MPGLLYLYYSTGTVPDVSRQIAGNPDLGPERTISWEVGYDHSFGQAASLGVTGFYRDMEDLLTTIPRLTSTPGITRQFVNGASGHSQGLELSVSGRPTSYLFAAADFTLSWTHGLSSRPTESAEYSWDGSAMPNDETVYEFDRRRALNFTLGGQVPGTVPVVGGLGISTLTTLRCGLPYDNAFHGVYDLERNENRYPMRTSTDLHAWKGIRILGADVTGYIDIFNIFDRKNVDWIVDVAWYEAELGGDCDDMDRDPKGPMHNSHAYAPARHFLFGLEVDW